LGMRGGISLSNVNIGTKMRTLDVGQKQAAYTGVIVHAGQTEDGQSIDYSVGNDTGSVLEVTVPNGTLALAYMLLDKLKLRGFRYQPFEADGAIADPAIEIGDNITANNVPSIVMGIQTNHSRLMASTLKAPNDEEVNHEWKYEPRSERQFKRESAYTRSRLTINETEISAEVVRATDAENVLSGRITVASDAITAEVIRATAAEGTLRSSIQINAESISSEVTRATNAEGSLSTRITQNATDITAKVSKTGGSSSSFAWTLTDSSWTLTSNGTDVFKVTSGGAEVKGKITATSGYIGNGSSGFEIGNTYIRNGMTSLDDITHDGVYIGTDGIALGKGKFKATSNGVITATSGTIGGFTFGQNSLSKSTPDVSTVGQSQYQMMLQAPSTASTSNAAIVIRHRDYTGSGYGDWVNDFYVTYGGRLTANTGVFKGDVYAGSIKHGGDYGTLSGSGLTDGSIVSGKYGLNSIGNGNMIANTLNTGSMVSSIGTSLGYANFSNAVFNNQDVAAYVTAQYYFIRRNNANYSMSLHTHKFYVRDGYIYMSSKGGEADSVDWTGGEQGFNIADTQYYKDAVASARSAGYDDGYAQGKIDGVIELNRITSIYVTAVFSDSVGLRAYHSQGDYSYARLYPGDYWDGYDS